MIDKQKRREELPKCLTSSGDFGDVRNRNLMAAGDVAGAARARYRVIAMLVQVFVLVVAELPLNLVRIVPATAKLDDDCCSLHRCGGDEIGYLS